MVYTPTFPGCALGALAASQEESTNSRAIASPICRYSGRSQLLPDILRVPMVPLSNYSREEEKAAAGPADEVTRMAADYVKNAFVVRAHDLFGLHLLSSPESIIARATAQ
jgi:hypothetical protein